MLKKRSTLIAAALLLLCISLSGLLLGSDIFPVLKIWVLLVLLGIGFFPLAARLFRSFSDRGWIQSRVIGLTLAGFAAFNLILSHTFRFRRPFLIVCALVLAAAVWGIHVFRKKNGDSRTVPLPSTGDSRTVPLPPCRGADLTLILTEELLFFALLAFWCYLYGFDMEGALHSEGPMDYGLLSTLMRSDTLPPADMWNSSMNFNNYYYGCHYFAVFLAKITGVRTNELFTIVKALAPAASGTLMFSIVGHLLKDRKPDAGKAVPYAGGFFAAVTLVFSSNLHYILYGFLKLPYSLHGDYTWWSMSRYIGAPDDVVITEIPSFSFLIGDYHAHIADLLYVLCFLSILYAWLRQTDVKKTLPSSSGPAETPFYMPVLRDPYLYFCALFIAVFFMNNTWDAPIYTFVYVAASGFMAVRRTGEKRLRAWLFRCVYLAVLLFVFSAPFRVSFTTGSVYGLSLPKVHSEPDRVLVFWAMHLLVVLIFILYLLYEHKKEHSGTGPAAFVRGLSLPDFFAVTAALCAVVLILVPEIVWVMDIFGGRVNTVFKTYLEAVILLDIACSYILIRLLTEAKKPLVRIFSFVMIYVFCLSCGYFLFSVNTLYGNIITDRTGYYGIDAESFVERLLPEDASAIRWLEDNAGSGQPHILEATGREPTRCGRVSSLTGLPTVIGWFNHEWQFSASLTDAVSRTNDVWLMYTSSNAELVRSLLQKYNIQYIFVGTEEKNQYHVNEEMLKRFGKEVFRNEYDTYILQVSP